MKINASFYCILLTLFLLAGCTLKLTTDLSKVIGIDSPEELMGSEEAQQIATRIGEGMGTKIMEGEILAEDMGKGFGEVFLEPRTVPITTDPVSVALIEQAGLEHLQDGNYQEATDAFKRTNNLYKLEQIALIPFDQGDTTSGANLHQYLADRGWAMRPPYLVSKQIEDEGLDTINSSFLKEIDPEQYNTDYSRRRYSIFDTITLNEDYIKKYSVTKQEMLSKLSEAPVIILADAYFVVKQHTCFQEIISSLNHDKLTIGLEQQLVKIRNNKKAAETLNYLPLLTYIDDNEIDTFTHGPGGRGKSANTVNFFDWDSTLAEKVGDLVSEGRQVILIVGDTHASPGHLPFLVEKQTGIKPSVVVQNPLDVTIEQILEENVMCSEELTSRGIGSDTVLDIENDFYLNTEIPAQDLQNYLDLFDLKPLVKTEQK